MNRCLTSFLATTPLACSVLLAGSLSFLPAPASAQAGGRAFPPGALRGTLVVTAPPEVLLDGRADRLAPGARIRDAQNLLSLSGQLVGQELTVNYQRDGAGLLHEVWILSAEEAREKRAGALPARDFVFGPEAGAAPRDDGKTPFHQLPSYPRP